MYSAPSIWTFVSATRPSTAKDIAQRSAHARGLGRNEGQHRGLGPGCRHAYGGHGKPNFGAARRTNRGNLNSTAQQLGQEQTIEGTPGEEPFSREYEP